MGPQVLHLLKWLTTTTTKLQVSKEYFWECLLFLGVGMGGWGRVSKKYRPLYFVSNVCFLWDRLGQVSSPFSISATGSLGKQPSSELVLMNLESTLALTWIASDLPGGWPLGLTCNSVGPGRGPRIFVSQKFSGAAAADWWLHHENHHWQALGLRKSPRSFLYCGQRQQMETNKRSLTLFAWDISNPWWEILLVVILGDNNWKGTVKGVPWDVCNTLLLNLSSGYMNVFPLQKDSWAAHYNLCPFLPICYT